MCAIATTAPRTTAHIHTAHFAWTRDFGIIWLSDAWVATPDLQAYRFYRFRTERLKVFDEAVFGAGAFVTATIHSGQRLIWERTDISSGATAH